MSFNSFQLLRSALKLNNLEFILAKPSRPHTHRLLLLHTPLKWKFLVAKYEIEPLYIFKEECCFFFPPPLLQTHLERKSFLLRTPPIFTSYLPSLIRWGNLSCWVNKKTDKPEFQSKSFLHAILCIWSDTFFLLYRVKRGPFPSYPQLISFSPSS